MPSRILISDPTLRDGSHAIKHQLKKEDIALYSKLAEEAQVPILEIGHGNGLGASSLQLGTSLISDIEMIEESKKHLKNTKLGIHVIPGFATIKRDLNSAIDAGVDVIRVASHCTEADITKRHIEYARNREKEVYGVLMMSHMAPASILVEEALKMKSYGAQGIIIMDSAGAYLPANVREKIRTLVHSLNMPIGFHAHNNLGMAIANSIAAVEEGAVIVDATIRGFGAGAGNAQLEILVAVLQQMGYETDVDLYKLLDAADIVEKSFVTIPYVTSSSIVSGMAGVFSGFSKPVERIAKEYNLDPKDIFFELGKRRVVAGQEDLILEVAVNLSQLR
ncbi:4-hydroxy 2-oxovalerate aldolase [Paenibacillus algorifonticola]|uniref:4-hydroxy-2-oxovalerate aldolase n=1 Tax=Paenibacillus algorifonticola TaxID=684063 RepID=A0A1I2DZL7_9BACL|nr:4-hydroxy-2-oxovalerate aldolase [Paenibacillus algorifonticola]SFE86064.1 4-hydroxy 2-oxovalerate aldolase [Paenibacillus algorifonticola]